METFITKLFEQFQTSEDSFNVNENAWDELGKNLSFPLSKTFNHFGTHLAKMYNQGTLTYEFCDTAINIAWEDWNKIFNLGNEVIPPDFFEVYEAFDAGEYYRKDDKSDNPVAEHTDPLIQVFLKRIKTEI